MSTTEREKRKEKKREGLNELITKGSRAEGGPTVNVTTVAGDDGGVHAVTDHHEVPLLLLDLNVLVVDAPLDVNDIAFHGVVRGSKHGIHDTCVVAGAILGHYGVNGHPIGLEELTVPWFHPPRKAAGGGGGGVVGSRVNLRKKLLHEGAQLLDPTGDEAGYNAAGAFKTLHACLRIGQGGAQPCPQIRTQVPGTVMLLP